MKATLSELLLTVSHAQISSNSRIVLLTPRPEGAQVLCDTIARESRKADNHLISRLLILKCDRQTLADVFTLESQATASTTASGQSSEGGP